LRDEPDAAAEGRVGPFEAPSAEAALVLGTSLDLSEIARLVLAAVLREPTSAPDGPGLADAASVFALEQLLRGGESAGSGDGDPLVVRRLGTRFLQPGRPDPKNPEAAFPPGEVVAFAADGPFARCVYHGRPVCFEQADGQALGPARPGSQEILSGYGSFLAVPMTAGDTVVGFLALARAHGTPPFGGGDDASTAARLAAHAGTGIANAVKLMRQRSIADALQRGLLVTKPLTPSGLDVAGRCQPAAGHTVGGDWYDLVPLPGGRTGIVVGDVMGHGPEAAAVMAQLRAAAHALADLDLAPAELLQRLNRLAATLHRITLATCVYAVIDPEGQSCTLAGAGHLPPVLALPDGSTRVPELPAGQSLGLGTAIYGQARIKLPPGAILALYTDGLVETRTRSYDHGILALRSVLSRERGSLESICDALVRSLAERYEDDITVVLARIPPR
jgi:Stage II sporulation protein E (SpoIIE)/GAF domain